MSLTELNVRLNRLLDDGGHILLEAVASSEILRHANLSGNLLRRRSAKSAARTLLHSKSLLSLDLSCNDFDESDIQLIMHSLKTNKVSTSRLAY